MSIQDELISVSTSVLLEHMRPRRKVHWQPMPYTKPLLPPPPVPVQTPDSWPACFQDSIDNALKHVWADGTIKNYAYGIRTFLAFCAKHEIPPDKTFPASDFLITAFIAAQQETVSNSTIKNYLSGIRAWHVGNGFVFTRSDRLNLIARATRPLSNSRPPRPPVTLEMLLALSSKLNLLDPLDSCIFACATCAFWGLARLGELLPASYNYDHKLPPFPSPASISAGDSGSLCLRLPWTKTKKWLGETIYLSQQDGPTNPVTAIKRHIQLNSLAGSTLLFSFHDEFGSSVLLKSQFLKRCNDIWSSCNLTQTSGHSFRIGGTSHLLLCGVDTDIIKKSGRWSSDSFLRYWRNLDTVIPRRTTRIRKKNASGPSGEPRPSLGCGLPPSGLATPDGDSSLTAPSQDGAVVTPI